MLPAPDPFDTPFFNAHTERKVIEIADHRGRRRAYTFPTFFAHTPAVMMLFTADARRARDLLGGVALEPVRVGRTRCLFAVAAYRYGQISDGMTGYNELALGLPVSTSRVPIAPALLRKRWPAFGVHVLDLPVDSEENCRRGVTIWGLPKTMKRFHYQDAPASGTAHRRTIEVRDGDTLCLRLAWTRGGRRGVVSELNRAYSVKDGKLQRSRAFIDGACWQFTRLSPLAREVTLELGSGRPYADVAALDLDPKPLLVRDFDSLSTVLYGPEPA